VIGQFLILTASCTTATAHCRPRITTTALTDCIYAIVERL